MKALWRQSPQNVRSLVAEVSAEKPLAYTTVLTIVSRLVQKGLVTKSVQDGQHTFVPALSRQEFLRQAWRTTWKQFLDRFGNEAIAAFSAEFVDLEPKERQRLQQLLEPDEQ